jgi:predicted nucleic acid-binding protein
LKKILVETGFLLALNPEDRNHEYAIKLLHSKNLKLYLSPVSLIELNLLLRAKKRSEDEIISVFKALKDIIRDRVSIISLRFTYVIKASELRKKYKELTLFDSIHSAICLVEKISYGDLDEKIRNIVNIEKQFVKSK